MKHKRIIIATAIALAALALPHLIFLARAPVLVVTDAPFAALYGETRIQRQRASASRTLYRRVKPVMVADGASPDILIIAISSAASKPFCVIFPRHQSSAAERYHEQFPEIPVVLFGGAVPASGLPAPEGLLCVYGTDRETDLYRAGLFAGILADARQRQEAEAGSQSFALWQDRAVTDAQRDLFSRGARERRPETGVVFVSSAGEMPNERNLSCVVLTGAGAEYLERRTRLPIIMFSWVDPAMVPKEIAVVFDDSPWALAVPAVRMAASRQPEGKIPSNPLIISGNSADNGIFRALRRAARKMP
jgi:hypothetical protein